MDKCEIQRKIAEFFHADMKKEDSLIRVMSSNVLNSNDPSSKSFKISYAERAKILCEYYLAFEPDFIGLQEVSGAMIKEFCENLTEKYSFAAVTPDGHHNFTPVLYLKDKYDLLFSEHVNFMENKDGCWSYQVALYSTKSAPQNKIIHINLHYHFLSTDTRLPNAKLVNKEIKELREKYPDVPIFVSGDYNCSVSSPEYKAMIEGTGMNSAMLLTDSHYGFKSWYHNIGELDEAKDQDEIDHICVIEESVKVVRHRKIRDMLICDASDHCPIFIDATI